MLSKILILPFMLILFSCFKTKAKEEITFKSCSGSVMLDLSDKNKDGYAIYDGPEGHLFLEITNSTEQDTMWEPKISRGDNSPQVDSRFELVVNQDTILMCGTSFLKIKHQHARMYEILLLFNEIKEGDKPDYVSDSSFYMKKIGNYLKNGQLIFTDLRNKKTIQIPKSPDFKIQFHLIPFD
ncbi:hypothetical protein ACFP1I_18355 [Dyadobacter subterraneus]|uniref:Uncharacterized protein n=1 Tax=Dyadobacter subterraneus TaxID=2773304 RepID=A0ABR9WRB8_9BACT|nr:hypothetical protein [Dyadobacter subterraneus]MBE9466639.1 hypothetical protein [Dyadobacter subterraneus]